MRRASPAHRGPILHADPGGAPAAPSRQVDQAVAFITSHADRDIDLGDIARASGASARSLAAAFHRALGVTPLQFLRQERYRRARGDLDAADPWGTTTVAAVAVRWGFPHLGRFAVDYRRRFGESPHETLRRG